MKKKVLAFLLASTMVIEPFSVAGAADFSDGMGQDTVQFSDDVEDVPEVENDGVDQFSTDAAGEGEEPTETHVQIGDKVWVDFDYSTGTATVSGTGAMWDYMDDGWDSKGDNQNPFAKIRYPYNNISIKKIIISDGITNIGNYFLYDYADDYNVVEVLLGSSVKKIGKYAFSNCNINAIILPDGLEELGDNSFDGCALREVTLPESIKSIGYNCFSGCYPLKKVILPDSLTNIPYGMFSSCNNLEKIILPSKLKILGERAFSGCRNLTEVTLPSTLEILGVEAFQSCNSLTEITLPSSLKDIEEDGFEISGAFRNCINLKKVNIEQGFSASIPGMMFENCKFLTEISIPENVSYIRFCAFSNCNRLTTIKINGAKTKISSDAFRDCKNLNTIESFDCSYARKIAEENNIHFNSLGEGSHQFTAQKVQIKEPTCTEKGIKAYRCEICGKTNDEEEIPAYDHKWDGGVITKQATETEEGVRTYTCGRCNETKTEPIPKLPSIQIEDASYGWLAVNTLHIKGITNKDVSYYVTYVPRGDDKPEYDQQHEREDTSDNYISAQITVPNYEIDVYIFAVDKNGNVTYAKITPDYTQRPQKPVYQVGDNVTAAVNGDTLTLTGTGETYEDYYWRDRNDSANRLNKTSIKHIIVENGITSLGSELFSHFENVESIILPTSLEYIGTEVFSNCYSLESIEIPNGVKALGSYIFNECERLKSISLPSTLTAVPGLIDIGGENVETVILNKGIERIGNNAFQNMNNLKNIIIPDSVSSIGRWAFASCKSLSNITLPYSITAIEEGAFSDCTSLDKIVLPNKLTSLGNDVFEYCNAEITFPSGLERIPELGRNAARKVNISEGVKIIGEDAFWACSNLKEITLPPTITSIESGAFFNTSISGFNYPQNIDSIPINAFCGTKLTEFSVPDNVKEIDDGAFYNCTDLVKISIPESVTYIGNDVFKNCRNLVIYGKRDSFAERYAYINNIKFVSGQYKVVFKDNGRTVNTYYIDEGGSVLTPPTLKEKPGYTLSWDADYTNIQEDMVINAVWTKKDNGGGNTTIIVSPSETNKYTVTFKDRGKIVKTEKVKFGDAAEYPYINRSGYELSWDKDFSKVTANITVNAVWTVIKPAKVTSLTAEAGKKSIALSWDETEYTSYYLVYRKADGETEYTQVAKTTKVLWTDSKAVPGTQYSYKVVAVRSLEGKKYQGADSDVVTTKIGTPQIGDVYSVGDLNQCH